MSRANYQPRNTRPNPWRRRLTLYAVLVVLVFCVGLVVGYLKHRDPSPQATTDTETSPLPSREVLLYFAALDGRSLVAQSAYIDDCLVDEDCLRATVGALISGPEQSSGLAPILPPQVELRNLSVDKSMVTVDFSQDLLAAHPGGTQSELLTIYGLTDTLVVNFPHLRQVRILIDGEPTETLKGHVDLRQPVNPDFSLVEEGHAPIGKMIDLPGGKEE